LTIQERTFIVGRKEGAPRVLEHAGAVAITTDRKGAIAMATITVPQSLNGTKPLAPARVIPLVGGKVDHLAELRALIRQAQDAERELTAELVRTMTAAGVDRLHGAQAEAKLEQRTTLRPDPELFLQETGAAGYGALSVSVTAARRLMASDDLAAICEATTTRVLRVEAIAPAPQVA
jgi:hypothetical protein